MVDVGDKPVTARVARASAWVVMRPETLELVRRHEIRKGDVLQVARVAGIMGAKRTSELVPLCHPLPLESVQVDLTLVGPDRVHVEARAGTSARTGVEMEVLTAVSVAALTVYDMCKAVDRGMRITDIVLEEKTGGVRGDYQRFQNF